MDVPYDGGCIGGTSRRPQSATPADQTNSKPRRTAEEDRCCCWSALSLSRPGRRMNWSTQLAVSFMVENADASVDPAPIALPSDDWRMPNYRTKRIERGTDEEQLEQRMTERKRPSCLMERIRRKWIHTLASRSLDRSSLSISFGKFLLPSERFKRKNYCCSGAPHRRPSAVRAFSRRC